MSNLTSQDNNFSSSAQSEGYLQRFFLGRLERMVLVRHERAALLSAGDADLRLLDKAVYSTFCDCLDLGAGEEARAVLRQESPGSKTSEPGNN